MNDIQWICKYHIRFLSHLGLVGVCSVVRTRKCECEYLHVLHKSPTSVITVELDFPLGHHTCTPHPASVPSPKHLSNIRNFHIILQPFIWHLRICHFCNLHPLMFLFEWLKHVKCETTFLVLYIFRRGHNSKNLQIAPSLNLRKTSKINGNFQEFYFDVMNCLNWDCACPLEIGVIYLTHQGPSFQHFPMHPTCFSQISRLCKLQK